VRDKIINDQGLVVRHDLVALVEHWAIALSGLLLLVTGVFELPMANRYYLTSLPGWSWSGDFIKSLYIHYAAAVVFITAAVFHLLYHGIFGEGALVPRRGDLKESLAGMKGFFGKGKEPPLHKYLPEQRLAYGGMVFITAMLILSGLVKTYKNLYAPDMSLMLVLWATWVHNVCSVLFILTFAAHAGASLLKPNRPLIRGICTGTVRLDYARRRHPLWIKEMAPEAEHLDEVKTDPGPGEEAEKGEVREETGEDPPPSPVVVSEKFPREELKEELK
jgi:cytochrome b subunit of formate dehydrogenase